MRESKSTTILVLGKPVLGWAGVSFRRAELKAAIPWYEVFWTREVYNSAVVDQRNTRVI